MLAIFLANNLNFIMKKLLFALLFCSIKCFAQESAQPFTFPVVDSMVMYQQVSQAPGKSAADLYLKATIWYSNNFNYRNGRIISSDPTIDQITYGFITEVNNKIVNYTLRLDFKDGRYRYRLYNIRSTVKGKEDAIFFRKYLVDVPAELNNKMVLGQVKGYSKSQKKDIEDDMVLTDIRLKTVLKSLTDALGYTPRDNDF